MVTAKALRWMARRIKAEVFRGLSVASLRSIPGRGANQKAMTAWSMGTQPSSPAVYGVKAPL